MASRDLPTVVVGMRRGGQHLEATLPLTVGTGKAGLPNGNAQRRRRGGGPEGRRCPQSSTRGARGMDVPCTHIHTTRAQNHTQTHNGSSDFRR